ncbi:MAG: pirin family protein [Myxococcus sp.]|nr:pirin family protein [Myxococcus sp.]
MITLRRANSRHVDELTSPGVWHSFYPFAESGQPHLSGFSVLEELDEDRLPPGAELPRHPHRPVEWLTYVHEGALAWVDELGCSGVLRAGEFQRVASGRQHRHREVNASSTEWVHVFRLGLRPSNVLVAGHEQRRFSLAERRGALQLVASHEPVEGVLRLDQDVRVYSAFLEPGHHVARALEPGRVAWVQMVSGDAAVQGDWLSTGDGAAVSHERVVSITAATEAEVLIIDLPDEEADQELGWPS